MRAGGDAVQLIGPVGTAAMWNRSYFHRASPNRGSVRRRVLKISFQPAGLPNDRIGLPEFTDARAHLSDPALLALIDANRVGSTTRWPTAGKSRPAPAAADDAQRAVPGPGGLHPRSDRRFPCAGRRGRCVTQPSSRLRALVVGSGYRVRNAFLPALSLLDSHIDVVGVHSRTLANASRAAERWGVPAIEDPRTLRPGDIDLALVSVTVTNNVAVLKSLAHLAPGAALVIDTPASDVSTTSPGWPNSADGRRSGSGKTS